MTLLLVPAALLAIVGLLVLATELEQGRARVLVRLTIRGGASPEATEAIIATELAPILQARRLTDRY